MLKKIALATAAASGLFAVIAAGIFAPPPR